MKGNEQNSVEAPTLALLHLAKNESSDLGTVNIEICAKAAEALQHDSVSAGEDVTVELISHAHYQEALARIQALEADIADFRENLASVLPLHLAVSVNSVASMIKNESTGFAVAFGGHLVSVCDDEGGARRLAFDLRKSLVAGLSNALNDSRCSFDVSTKIELPASVLDPAKW